MKNRIHKSLELLLADKHVGTKISLFVPIKGDLPAHVLFAGLRDSAIKLIPDKEVAKSFRTWVKTIRDDHREHEKTRTMALFYSETVRQVLYLEKDIPSRVVVSQSWHVKPLLFVADSRPWGHIFEFNENGISIIRSDGETHEVSDTLTPSMKSPMPSKFWPEEIERDDLRNFITLAAHRIPEGTLVQISGAPDGFARSPNFWQHFWPNVIIGETNSASSDRRKHLETFTRNISAVTKELDPDDLLREISGLPAISDPALITRRILERKIARVFISLEAIQWGELDSVTGAVKKTKFQKDHVDEDILDDIAELALKAGVEVRILRQSSFPGHFEIIAV